MRKYLKPIVSLWRVMNTKRREAAVFMVGAWGVMALLVFGGATGALGDASAVTTTTVALDPVSESTSLITNAAPIAGEIIVAVVGVGITVLLLLWGVMWVWGFFRARRPHL
jgi:hypothetical protein